MPNSNSYPSQEEILDRFRHIVAKSLRIDASQVTADTHLDDLGADSLDFLEITMETESQFNVSISDKSILKTAEQIFGPGILEQEGVLTQEGKKLLRHRMPELAEKYLQRDVSIDDLNHLFCRVGTWVGMIQRLAEHTPTECTKCKGGLAPTPTGQMKCTKCATELEIQSGEEINRKWVREYYEKEYLPSETSATG